MRAALALLVAIAVSPMVAAQTPPPAATAPTPLPLWFQEIDTAKKGEVTRAEFLKYRMRTFEALDTKKAGKLTLDEFLKVAEPPFMSDGPGLPSLEERRKFAKADFENLDTNRDGVLDRAEAEAVVQAEFNQYTASDKNKITANEVRAAVQASLDRERAAQKELEARRRQGKETINEFIDQQLQSADQLDTNHDGRVSRQEYAAVAGPKDGPAANNLPPYPIRLNVTLRKFQEIDTNKDGFLDRPELVRHALTSFIAMDADKDCFLDESEFKKGAELEQAKLRALVAEFGKPSTPPPAPLPPEAPPAHTVGSLEQALKDLQTGDVALAEKDLRGLATERDPRAQFLLGLYVYGSPDSKLFDLSKAVPLLLDAAQHGYVPAMLPLAGAYVDGKGVSKLPAISYMWLLIAERWHAPNVRELSEQVARELKPEEIDEAKRAAAAYTFKMD